MATEILRPQDCLIQQIRVPTATFSRHRSYTNCSNYYHNHHAATSSSYRKPVTRPYHSKRVHVGSGKPVKVTILRKGQSLDSSSLVAVKSDVYAGSAFSVVAPSPSALPLPSFPTKKQASPVIDDSATRDLRRLLRLE
ncbi:hypothetical protein Lal_00049612 [Lupinus albus]|uniref:Uncharacterized protein n=1 Tax=Lupinus albus TaxID=3870 RepID=A0A6A5M530_LUPAL|nr:hypothetical protein Lalb_Chr12g0196391 [Lupinus albus]KAF1867183.1 hypothetical protein Lal_00049612 [Lupinus albus]